MEVLEFSHNYSVCLSLVSMLRRSLVTAAAAYASDIDKLMSHTFCYVKLKRVLTMLSCKELICLNLHSYNLKTTMGGLDMASPADSQVDTCLLYTSRCV